MIWLFVVLGVLWVMWIGFLYWLNRKYTTDALDEIRTINQDTNRMDREMKAYLKKLDERRWYEDEWS